MNMTTVSKTPIEDSGARKTFESGAVRDIHVGKGRFDLMPLLTLSEMLDSDRVIGWLGVYQEEHNPDSLMRAIAAFEKTLSNRYDAMLKLAIHFENGALKYGEHNWEKGIDESSYIDSACRHYIKYRAGWTDEDHQSAFLWNVMCLYWSITQGPLKKKTE